MKTSFLAKFPLITRTIPLVLLALGIAVLFNFVKLPYEPLRERSVVVSVVAFIYAFLFLLVPVFFNWLFKFYTVNRMPLAKVLRAKYVSLKLTLQLGLTPLEWLSFSVILLAGIIIRFYFINQPMRYDEAATAHYFVNVPIAKSFYYLEPNNHVLHTFASKFCVELFGNHPWSLRLPALIAGILCMPLIFMASRNIFGQNSGFLSMALMSVMPIIILYDTQARGYSMVNFFTLSGILIGLSIINKPGKTNILLLSVNNAFGLFTIPTFLFPAAGLYLWVAAGLMVNNFGLMKLIKTLAFPSAIIMIVMTFVFYTPVIIATNGIERILSNSTVEALTWPDFINAIQAHASYTYHNLSQGLTVVSKIFFLTMFLFGMVAAVKKKQALVLLLFWSFIFSAITIYFLKQSIPFPRTWIYLLPIIFLVIDYGFSGITNLMPKRVLRILAPVFLALLMLSAFMQMKRRNLIRYNDHGVFVEAEEVAEFLKINLRKGDVLHMTYPVKYNVLYYLNRQPVPRNESGEEKRHFYILRSEKNNLENTEESDIAIVASFGQAEIFVSTKAKAKLKRVR